MNESFVKFVETSADYMSLIRPDIYTLDSARSQIQKMVAMLSQNVNGVDFVSTGGFTLLRYHYDDETGWELTRNLVSHFSFDEEPEEASVYDWLIER